MKKIILFLAVFVFLVSCSDDDDVFELQGSWPWKIELRDGVGHTGIPFASGEENIHPTYVVTSEVRAVVYEFVGSFGGLPEPSDITCQLLYRKNDEPAEVIEEISADNAKFIDFEFKGQTKDRFYQDGDQVYLYLQLTVSGELSSIPPMIGYEYKYGGFSTLLHKVSF